MIILQRYRHHLRGNNEGEGDPISRAKASKSGEIISVTEFRRTEVRAICLLKTLWLPHGLGCSSRPPASTICLVWVLPTAPPKASVLFFRTFGTSSSHSSTQQAHGRLMARPCDSASALLQSPEASWPCSMSQATEKHQTARPYGSTHWRFFSAYPQPVHTCCTQDVNTPHKSFLLEGYS